MIDLIFALGVFGTICSWAMWGIHINFPTSRTTRTWFITAMSATIFIVVWAIVYGHGGLKWMC